MDNGGIMQNIFREVKTQLVFKHRTGIDFAAHIHDDLELVYVKQGGGIAYCDGRQYTLTEGSFFLVFPNQIHQYSNCPQGAYIVLIMKPSRLLHLDSFFGEGQPESAVCSDCPELAALLEIALTEFLQEGDSCVVDGYLTAFFGKLLKHYTVERSSLSHSCVLSILQYCARHFRENISVKDISEQLHISPSHISHIFNRRLHISFRDYINALRLNEAVKLLENRAFTIAEVAGQAGFPTIRTFNRAFAKHYGQTPSAYRSPQ